MSTVKRKGSISCCSEEEVPIASNFKSQSSDFDACSSTVIWKLTSTIAFGASEGVEAVASEAWHGPFRSERDQS